MQDIIKQYPEASVQLFVQPSSPSTQLIQISHQCEGMSGRALRQLPLLMHARLEQADGIPIEDAMSALAAVVQQEKYVVEHGGA